MIAYQFPPVGGSGVQRTLKFVKYLPAFGWQACVLTRDTGKMLQRDDTLLKDIPENTDVVRTKAWDLTALPGKMALLGKFVAWKILIPDGEVLWMKGALTKARAYLEENQIKTIYSTSYPYSDHLIGLSLKQEDASLHWVADFRDEWTNNPYLLDHPHRKSRMKREKVLEKAVLEGADIIITNSGGMKDNFIRSYPELSLTTRMHVIPNGFDSDDFDEFPPMQKRGDIFVMTYTGALYGRRKPDLFLAAIGQLVKEGALPKGRFALNFIGSYKADVLEGLAKEQGIFEELHLKGYQAHSFCVQAMAESHALLLLEGGGPGAEAFFTGKVFEYIHTGRPILAVVPQKGAAAGVVRETETGLVADSEDIDGIKAGFLALYQAWEKGQTIFEPRNDKIQPYHRKALTKSLVTLLESENKRQDNQKDGC